jgi:hypothetical protein
MDFPTAFNILEAIWWSLLSIACWWNGRGAWKVVSRTAALLLALFALSDLMEVQTGAWWRPWWLAVVKGGCLAGLTTCGIWALLIKRRMSREATLSDGA